MQIEVRSSALKLSHEDEQRYRLVMTYLPLIEKEKGQRGFLKKLKKQWQAHRRYSSTRSGA